MSKMPAAVVWGLFVGLFVCLDRIDAFIIPKKASLVSPYRTISSQISPIIRQNSAISFAASTCEDLYLGIDCGTQGLKALVYNAKTRDILGVDSVSYGLNELSSSKRVGCAEQDPSIWCDALFKAANSALDKAQKKSQQNSNSMDAETESVVDVRSRIRAIGVSGQQHGMVCLDEAYNVIRPAKLWCDSESSGEADELSNKLDRNIVAAFTISKVRRRGSLYGLCAYIVSHYYFVIL
jgi:hypothetical protein